MTADDFVTLSGRLFAASPNPSERIGVCLTALYRARVAADYRLEARDPARSDFAKAHVELAVEVQSLLARCRQNDAQLAIRAGIDAYLRRIGAKGT